MMAVIEYSATANLSDSLLKIKSTRDAIATAGVAARWNQPRSLGGATGGATGGVPTLLMPISLRVT